MKLKGKVALVTGSGRGLGRAMALAFAKEGADVAVNAAHQETANEVASTITREFKRKTIAIQADVAKADEVDAMVNRTLDELGKIDILVNNTGIGQEFAPTTEQSVEKWDRLISVNLRGTYLCSRRVSGPVDGETKGRSSSQHDLNHRLWWRSHAHLLWPV